MLGRRHLGTAVMFGLCVAGCTDTRQSALKYIETTDTEPPFAQTFDADMRYTDSGIVRARLLAPVVQDFNEKEGVVRRMPRTFTVYLFDRSGASSGILQADSGVIFSYRDEVSAYGNVHFRNDAGEELTTQELHFNTRTFVLFTQAFVTIKRNGEVIYGQGLEATDNFSRLRLQRPMGQFYIQDDAAWEPSHP